MTSDAMDASTLEASSEDAAGSAERAAAAEMVARAREQGRELTGPDGLLKVFTKNVLESALNEEMTEHLGHEKTAPSPTGRMAARGTARGRKR